MISMICTAWSIPCKEFMRLPKLPPSAFSHQPSFSNLGRVIFTFQVSTFNPENLSTMDSIIQQKSRDFAIRIINCYNYLVDEKYEKVMSKQLLRCGTSMVPIPGRVRTLSRGWIS